MPPSRIASPWPAALKALRKRTRWSSETTGGPPKVSAPAPDQPNRPSGEAAPTPRSKALLFINAQGPFIYEPGADKDRAEFNNQVNVIRKLDAAMAEKSGGADTEHYDQLDC